jgi:hypothetical protein
MGKALFKSKTFWANILSLGAMVATASGHPAAAVIADPAMQAQVIGIGTALVNVVLRLVTDAPITSVK